MGPLARLVQYPLAILSVTCLLSAAQGAPSVTISPTLPTKASPYSGTVAYEADPYTHAIHPEHGAGLAGAKVDVTFGDNSTESVVWKAIQGNADAGHAVGSSVPGWSLEVDGGTWEALGGTDVGRWVLSNTTGRAIKKVVIDLSPIAGVFDRGEDVIKNGQYHNEGPYAGSYEGKGLEGTGIGREFKVVDTTNAHSSLAITATYLDAVAESGNWVTINRKNDNQDLPFYGKDRAFGDAWAKLQIEFTNTGHYASGATNLRMVSDVDVTDGLTVVPEPSSALLASLGLLSLGFLRRRRALWG